MLKLHTGSEPRPKGQQFHTADRCRGFVYIVNALLISWILSSIIKALTIHNKFHYYPIFIVLLCHRVLSLYWFSLFIWGNCQCRAQAIQKQALHFAFFCTLRKEENLLIIFKEFDFDIDFFRGGKETVGDRIGEWQREGKHLKYYMYWLRMLLFLFH